MKLRCVERSQNNHVFTTSRRSAVYLCESFTSSSRITACYVTMAYIDPKRIEWYCIWYKDPKGTLIFIKALPQYLADFAREVAELKVFNTPWESLPF